MLHLEDSKNGPTRQLGEKQFIKRQKQYLAFYFYLSYGNIFLNSITRFLNNHYELYYNVHFLVCLVCIFCGFFYIKAGKHNPSWPERAITRMIVVQKPSTSEQKLCVCVCVWEHSKLLLCLIQPRPFTIGTFLPDLVHNGIETSHHHNALLSKASH